MTALDEARQAARELVSRASSAVESGPSCGWWGDDAEMFEFFSRLELLESLCDRQRRSVRNLHAMLAQFESALAASPPQIDRAQKISDDMSELAVDLIGETEAVGYAAMVRDALRRAVDVGLGALDDITGALGPIGTLLVVVVLMRLWDAKTGRP